MDSVSYLEMSRDYGFLEKIVAFGELTRPKISLLIYLDS